MNRTFKPELWPHLLFVGLFGGFASTLVGDSRQYGLTFLNAIGIAISAVPICFCIKTYGAYYIKISRAELILRVDNRRLRIKLEDLRAVNIVGTNAADAANYLWFKFHFASPVDPRGQAPTGHHEAFLEYTREDERSNTILADLSRFSGHSLGTLLGLLSAAHPGLEVTLGSSVDYWPSVTRKSLGKFRLEWQPVRNGLWRLHSQAESREA